MILNWTDLQSRSAPIDIAIVGAGAAGLAMADAMIGSGLSVLVLEAGDEAVTPAGQEPFEGELADPAAHPWLHHFRARALGGASRIWGGRCVPYDPIDFEARLWIPSPGWPISLASLTPYYEKAQAAAEAGPFDYDPVSALPGRPPEYAPNLDGDLLATRLERFSRPTNFWRRFEQGIRRSDNINLLMNTPVTHIQLTADGKQVDHLAVRARGTTGGVVRARHYVLATGGLETVRLLLASNDVVAEGVGGQSGHLGRYYMSHLAATAGRIVFNEPSRVMFDYETDPFGIYVRRRIALTAKAQRQIEGLNVAFRTHLPDPADPGHRDPILSAMFLVKDLILYEYGRKLRDRPPTVKSNLAHMANIARDPIRLLAFAQNWARKRTLASRKLPSIVLGSRTGEYALEFHAEQSPNPQSRITLAHARDSLGMQRLHVDWRLCDEDLASLERSYALLDSELRRSGVGKLIYEPGEPARQARTAGAYGGHHLGAARMAADARNGVVDEHCQVHGVRNLHLASSAVFPTSSQANPTLTILALALRLGERLGRQATAAP